MAITTIEAEIKQAENFTEAQIISDGIPNLLQGQSMFAVDTKRWIYRQAVTAGSPITDYVFDSRDNEFDYTDYAPQSSDPSYLEGRFWYDDNEKKIKQLRERYLEMCDKIRLYGVDDELLKCIEDFQ